MLDEIKEERYIVRKEFFGGIIWDNLKKDYYMISDLEYNKLKDYGNIKSEYKIVRLPSSSDRYVNFPLRIHLAFSNNCNTECAHCFFSDLKFPSKKVNLSFDKIKEMLMEMANLGCMELFIGGGEPFMRKDWFELFKFADDLNIQLFVFTNGLLIDKSVIVKLNSLSNLRYLSISSEGWNKKLYSNTRDSKLWDTLQNTLCLLKENAIFPLYLRYTATSRNIVDFEKFVDYVNVIGDGKIGIKVRPILPTGNAKEHTDLLLDYHEYLDFLKSIKNEIANNLNINISIYKDEDLNSSFYRYSKKTIGFSRFTPIYFGFGGSGGYTSIYIDPYGYASPCVMMYNEFVPDESDNLSHNSLYYLWHNAKSIEKRRDLNGNAECISCDYYIWCRGGCRARAIFNSKNPNSKDNWCFKDLNKYFDVEEIKELVTCLCS